MLLYNTTQWSFLMNKEQERAEAVRLFRAFKSEIIRESIKLSTVNYANADVFGDKWRDIIPYDANLEQMLIQKTNQFVFINVKTKQLKFIKKLTKGMADYLSGYTVHSNKFETRRQAAQAMESELFEKANHIRYLIANIQAQNQAHEEKLNRPNKTETHKRIRKRIGQIDVKDQAKNFSEAQKRYITMRGQNKYQR